MSIEKTRSILAITIVIGVFLTASIIVLSGMQDGIDLAKEFSGIFSGIVGTIIGFYFGKKDSD
jgi:hypothetical protein